MFAIINASGFHLVLLYASSPWQIKFSEDVFTAQEDSLGVVRHSFFCACRLGPTLLYSRQKRSFYDLDEICIIMMYQMGRERWVKATDQITEIDF